MRGKDVRHILATLAKITSKVAPQIVRLPPLQAGDSLGMSTCGGVRIHSPHER